MSLRHTLAFLIIVHQNIGNKKTHNHISFSKQERGLSIIKLHLINKLLPYLTLKEEM